MLLRCVLCAVIFVLTACTPATSTPLPTRQSMPIVEPVSTVIVTLTPAYHIEQYAGEWRLDLVYRVLNRADIDEIRFTGSTDLTVEMDNTISGEINFQTIANDISCVPSLIEDTSLHAKISGVIRSDMDGRPAAELILTPTNPREAIAVSLTCPDRDKPAQYSEPLLWSALMTVNGMNLSLPIGEPYSTNHESRFGNAQLTTEIHFRR